MFMDKSSGMQRKLSTVAADRIREMIVSGELLPGEPIAELKLADRLGISRTPIREAVSQLEFEGTLRSIPGRGAIVAEITRQDFQEINTLRVSLEPLAAMSAMHVIPRAVILREEEKWSAFLSDFRGGQAAPPVLFSEEDTKLHSLIVENCGNNRLKNILRTLHFQAMRYIYAHWNTRNYIEDTIVQHLEILRAFKEFDGDAVRDALAGHLEHNNMFVDIYSG